MSDGEKFVMTEIQLRGICEDCALEGAKKALADIGLHDESAANDIRDVRSLLEAYRIARRGFLTGLGKLIAIGVLAIIAFGVYWGSAK